MLSYINSQSTIWYRANLVRFFICMVQMSFLAIWLLHAPCMSGTPAACQHQIAKCITFIRCRQKALKDIECGTAAADLQSAGKLLA